MSGAEPVKPVAKQAGAVLLELKKANTEAVRERDRLRDERRRRILDKLSVAISNGGAWSFDDLFEGIETDDRDFMSKIFPEFVHKLKGVYPESGRLTGNDGVATILGIIRSERELNFHEVISRRLKANAQVDAIVDELAGDPDAAEVKREMARLEALPPGRRGMAFVFVAVLRRAETWVRKVRLRFVGTDQAKP